MKVLFFGAGVLGSLYAAKLHDSGIETALVARGRRYQDIKEHGVVLEHFTKKERSVSDVRVLDAMPEDEYFDLCVVLVQYGQLKDAAAALGKNKLIPTFLIMANYLEKLDWLNPVLGNGRVLFGHVNAGGERDGHVVKYMTAEYMTLGEPDGSKTERLKAAADLFRKTGFPVKLCSNIDAWKMHHVALVTPMCNALYVNDTCNYTLARNKHDVKRSVLGARKAMDVLVSLGFPIYPRKLLMMKIIPVSLLTRLFSLVLAKEVMDIGGARHAKNARDEMFQLSSGLIKLADRAGKQAPVLRQLHREAHGS